MPLLPSGEPQQPHLPEDFGQTVDTNMGGGQRERALSLFVHLAAVLNSHTELERALSEALPVILEIFALPTGWITLRRESDQFELVASAGLPPGLAAENAALLRWSPCRCQRMVTAGLLSTTETIIECERLQSLQALASQRSEGEILTGGLRWHYTVPLRTLEGEILGLLNLAGRTRQPLLGEQRDQLDLIGELLASAVQRIGLVSELRWLRSQERAQAMELAQQLLRCTTVPEIAHALFAALDPLLQAESYGVLLVDPSRQCLVLTAGSGWSEDWIEKLWLPLNPPTHNGPAWALSVGKPFAVQVDQPPLPFHVPTMVLDAGVRHSAFFPLSAGDRPVGVLVADYYTVQELTEDQLAQAMLLVKIAAVPLAQAQHQEELEKLRDELPMGFFLADARGALLHANPSFLQLVAPGQATALVGHNLGDFFAQRREGGQLFRKLRREGIVRGAEYRWRRLDGKFLWVRVTAWAQRTPEGELLTVQGTVEDISAWQRAQEQLSYLARPDSLTGLANRYVLIEALEEILALAWQSGQNGALLLFDLDNFKLVNDQLGHPAGDSILRVVGAQLSSVVPQAEVVARLGGDEFAILLYPVTRANAMAVGERIRAALQNLSLPLPQQIWRVQASCGVALLPEHGSTPEMALIAADRALRAAKHAGGGVAMYQPDPSPETLASQRRYRSQLQAALERNDLVLLGQPIFHVQKGEIVAYELLLRLRTGEGLVVPHQFLPHAEKLGLLAAIDHWVLGQALSLLPRLSTRVHINLSPRVIGDPMTQQELLASLQEVELPPGRLVLEITETAVILHDQVLQTFLERARQHGCLIALDDFGVGYSSLAQLRSLPVDFLKIDGSLVTDLVINSKSRKILNAIVSVAQAIGAQTIVEWIENEAQLDIVRTLGVDEAQGYLFGKPQFLQ